MKICGTLVRPARSTMRSRSAASRSIRTSFQPSPRLLRKFFAATQYAQTALVYRVMGAWAVVCGSFKAGLLETWGGMQCPKCGYARPVFPARAPLHCQDAGLTPDSRLRATRASSSPCHTPYSHEPAPDLMRSFLFAAALTLL